MSGTDFRELWLRYVEGETLAPAEQRSLLAALEADAELRAELLGDDELDGMLRARAAAGRDSDEFVGEARARLVAERDASRFVKAVQSKMRAAATPPDRPRPRAARLARSRSGAPSFRPALAVVAVLAAAAVVMVFAWPSPPAPRRDAPRLTRETPPAHREPTPAAPFAQDDETEAAALLRVATAEPGAAPAPVAPRVEAETRPAPAPKQREIASAEPASPAPPAHPVVTVPTAAPAPGPRRVAHLDITQGIVESARGEGTDWTTAVAGTALAAGDRVRTLSSRAKIVTANGSLLFVDRFTTFTIELADGRPGVAMVGGGVFADVADADVGFWVSTPQGRAVDLGTRFGVTSKGGRTTVYVAEGDVEASTDAGSARVKTRQEVLLLRRAMPPATVRRATSLAARTAWLHTLGGYSAERRLAFDLRAHETYNRAVVKVTAPDALTLASPMSGGVDSNVCMIFGKPTWSSYVMRARARIVRVGSGNYGVGLVALWNGPASSCRVRYFGGASGVWKITTGFAAAGNDRTRAQYKANLGPDQTVNVALEVRPVDGGTRVRARAWPLDAPEPADWPLSAVVPEGLRSTGRAGVWTYHCEAQFSGITVERLPDVATPPEGERR